MWIGETKMSRICDVCKEPIPYGTNDMIKIQFLGKFADRVRKLHGTDNFDFCGFACFGKFMPLEKVREVKGAT